MLPEHCREEFHQEILIDSHPLGHGKRVMVAPISMEIICSKINLPKYDVVVLDNDPLGRKRVRTCTHTPCRINTATTVVLIKKIDFYI